MSKPQVRAYTGATLIDGTGARPVKDAVVLVKGDSIADAGSSVKVPKDAEVVNASGYTMLPGLIDSHVHITSNGEANMLAALNYSPGLVQLMGAANAAKTLEAGYTTIRDMGAPGGYALSLKQAIQMGIARGPRIIACGTVIGQTGGHADFYLPSGVTFAGLSRIADGPDDCRKAAREQLRSGSDFLKICTSGGVMSPTDPVDTPQFTLAEIRAIVEEASAVGKTVASHCHGPTGIINAIVARNDFWGRLVACADVFVFILFLVICFY